MVCRIEVQRSVSRCLEQRNEIWLLSNVFYGFAEDGNELITLTPKFQSTHSSENFVGYEMKRFTTAAATDCIPDYELRNLRGMEETEETCEEWVQLSRQSSCFIVCTCAGYLSDTVLPCLIPPWRTE